MLWELGFLIPSHLCHCKKKNFSQHNNSAPKAKIPVRSDPIRSGIRPDPSNPVRVLLTAKCNAHFSTRRSRKFVDNNKSLHFFDIVKSWPLILFFVTVAVGINFRPLVNKLVWVSVNFFVERFFYKPVAVF